MRNSVLVKIERKYDGRDHERANQWVRAANHYSYSKAFSWSYQGSYIILTTNGREVETTSELSHYLESIS